MIKLASNRYYLLIAAAAAVYVSLTFVTPPDPKTVELYNFTPVILFWVRISVIIPVLFIWIAGSFAFTTLGRYIQLIKGTWEEAAFSKIKTGLGVIFWSGVVSSLINAFGIFLRGGINIHPLRPPFIIISHYFNVLPLLIGFIFILIGARILLRHVDGQKNLSLAWKIIVGIILSAVAYACLELIFTNPSRLVPPDEETLATYYLKDSLIILTLIIPLFISWIIGFVAAKSLSTYEKLVNGTIYKSFFSNMSWGLNALIFLSMFLQVLSAIGNERSATYFKELSAQSSSTARGAVLLLVYVILFIAGAAYLWLARGVKKLSQIETV